MYSTGHSIFRFVLECSYSSLQCSCVALSWLSFFFVSDRELYTLLIIQVYLGCNILVSQWFSHNSSI